MTEIGGADEIENKRSRSKECVYYLGAAGMDGEARREQAANLPGFLDVAVDELVGLRRVATLQEDRAHRPRVHGDHLAVLVSKVAQGGFGVPVADRHVELPDVDVGEGARRLEEVGDALRDGVDAVPVAERVAHGREEGVGARRAGLDVPAVDEGGPAAPFARDEEATTAQHARYLREKGSVVADLGSTRVRLDERNLRERKKWRNGSARARLIR